MVAAKNVEEKEKRKKKQLKLIEQAGPSSSHSCLNNSPTEK